MRVHRDRVFRLDLRGRIAAACLLASLVAVPAGAVAPTANEEAAAKLERLTLPKPAVVGGAASEAAPNATGVQPGGEVRGRSAGAPGFSVAARRKASEGALEAWAGQGAARRFDVRRNARTGLPHRLVGPPVSIVDGPGRGRAFAQASEVESAARAWLAAHPALWAGDETPAASDLALVKAHHVGATWFLVFQQKHLGFEVEGGRVDLRVRDDGGLALLGSDWMPGVDVDPRAAKLAQGVNDARARLEIGFDPGRDRALEAERVVLPLPAEGGGIEYRVADRVRHRTDDPPALWRTCVDANTGETLARENDLRYETGLVTAKVHPATPTDPLATLPLRDAVVGTALDSAYTNAVGRYTMANVSSGTPISAGLRGPYAEIHRTVASAPFLIQNAPPNDTLNFLWQLPQADSSEADAFYHVHVARQYVKKIEPAFNALDYRMPVTVNIPAVCNAYWDGVGVNFFRWGLQGNGRACANTGMIADVVYHEFGHGLTQETWTPFSPSGGMHEGLSDYLAATITNQPVIGRGFFGPGTSIRTTQNTQLVNAPSCGGEVHCIGNAVSGSLWDLRRNLIASLPDSATAIRLADSLFHFAGYGGSAWHDDYAIDLLVVDDDDGNLLNGTPHYGPIKAAFAAHGISVPDTTSGVWIAHTPLPDAAMGAGPFQVDAAMGSFADAFVAGSATLHWRYQGGMWHAVTMTPLGGENYRGAIPTPPGGGPVDYYLTASDAGQRTAASPEDAPVSTHTFYAGNLTTVFADDFETDQGWTSQTSAPSGRWMRVDPNGTPDPDYPTFFYQGEDDHTANAGRFAWVTGDTTAGLDPGAADVDGGCVTLLSPKIDLSALANARLEYWRWFTDETRYDDTLFVEVSGDDGATWTELERQPFTQNAWQKKSFDIASYVNLTSQFRFRVRTCDVGGGSIVEAMLDDFVITTRATGLVAAEDADVPGVAFVGRAQPSPASSGAQVRIAYGVPRAAAGEKAAPTVLSIVDASGRVVRTLVDEELAPGRYSAVWDGTNSRGERAGAGVYLIRFTTAGQHASGKVVRLN
jgi:Zn-dependent metalloprotease